MRFKCYQRPQDIETMFHQEIDVLMSHEVPDFRWHIEQDHGKVEGVQFYYLLLDQAGLKVDGIIGANLYRYQSGKLHLRFKMPGLAQGCFFNHDISEEQKISSLEKIMALLSKDFDISSYCIDSYKKNWQEFGAQIIEKDISHFIYFKTKETYQDYLNSLSIKTRCGIEDEWKEANTHELEIIESESLEALIKDKHLSVKQYFSLVKSKECFPLLKRSSLLYLGLKVRGQLVHLSALVLGSEKNIFALSLDSQLIEVNTDINYNRLINQLVILRFLELENTQKLIFKGYVEAAKEQLIFPIPSYTAIWHDIGTATKRPTPALEA